jgi:hypothetical protein
LQQFRFLCYWSFWSGKKQQLLKVFFLKISSAVNSIL